MSKKFKPSDNDNNDDRLTQVQEYSTVTSNDSNTLLPSAYEHAPVDLEYNLRNCSEFTRQSHYENISTPRNSIWTPD